MPDFSSRHSYVDADSDGSKQALMMSLGFQSVKTPGFKKAHESANALSSDPSPCRSNRVKNLVQQLTYDGYVAHHRAYMAKVGT